MRLFTTICAIAFMVSGLAGCGSSSALTVALSRPQDHAEPIPFTTTGAATAEGVLCAAGTTEVLRLESLDGLTITDDDWAAMFDAALDTGSVAEMSVYERYSCADGSGSFVLRWHNRFDFASFEFEGQQHVGTWEVSEGSGSYSALTGSGDIELDWDSGRAVLIGEVEAG